MDKKLKKVPFYRNKAFCIAPWTHTYISPQSERRLCCASREQASYIKQYIDKDIDVKTEAYNPKTLEEHWNGDFIKSIRRKMLVGEVPEECQVCHDQILNLHTYRQYFNKTLFPNKIKEAFESTDDSGATTMPPISFDYRFSNLCDFKCRMCGAQLSSSWEAEKIRYKEEDEPLEVWMNKDIRQKMTRFQKDVVESEFTRAIESGQVKEIYWVGGEPLLWPIHWKSMSYLVENDLSKDVFIRYNSNLGTIERKGVKLFSDLIPHFKDFNMCASIDGYGAIGEFIRTGLSWNQWKSNFEEGLKIADPKKHDQMVMDVTLTLPGLFSMKELFDQSLEWDVKMYVKIVFDFDPSIVLSPFALPRETLDEILDDLIAYCEPKTNSKNSALVDTFKVMKKRPVFQDKYPETWKEGFKSGREHQFKLAKIRKDGQDGRLTIEDIYQKNPKVLQWWQQEI